MQVCESCLCPGNERQSLDLLGIQNHICALRIKACGLRQAAGLYRHEKNPNLSAPRTANLPSRVLMSRFSTRASLALRFDSVQAERRALHPLAARGRPPTELRYSARCARCVVNGGGIRCTSRGRRLSAPTFSQFYSHFGSLGSPSGRWARARSVRVLPRMRAAAGGVAPAAARFN
ncbi:hypothetical protein AOLI_G00167940 [Acnodon oligacanthus]